MAKDFWWVLTVASLAWYSTITVYVAIRGGRDIRHMLTRLERLKDESPEE
jgi:hypothetical protein